MSETRPEVHGHPGSSDRCPSKFGHLRCHRFRNHGGEHKAPTGNTTTYWPLEATR